MTNIAPSQWLDAALSATTELAKTSLGFSLVTVVAKLDKLPGDMAGAWVALVGSGTSMQVGIASSLEGCHGLARAFLRMPESEGPLSEDDMVDALGEMANVIAGGVKRRVAHLDPSTRLGLPIVVRGKVEAGDRLHAAIAEVRLGAIAAQVIVLCDRHASGSAK
jgi:CheY-specific phosphatase CheX